MQLRKFYGRSLAATLARVRQALGPDAFIMETNSVKPGSAAERMQPGARYEIVAAREMPEPARHAPQQQTVLKQPPAGVTYGNPAAQKARALASAVAAAEAPRQPAPHTAPPPAQPSRQNWSLLHDLAELKAQLNELIQPQADSAFGSLQHPDGRGIDLTDYHALIAMGVQHEILAPHFRAWLQWRTASPQLRQYLATPGSAAAKMQQTSLREWLLHVWTGQEHAEVQGLFDLLGATSIAAPQPVTSGTQFVSLIGPSGAGKTSTLAKMASISRRNNRQKTAVVTFNTQLSGASDQWRKMGRLLDIEIVELSKVNEMQSFMNNSGDFGWVGIDTSGAFHNDSGLPSPGGNLFAECHHLKTVLVLPATQQEQISRQQMQMGKRMGASQIIFTKLDEARAGGALGSVLNLTLGQSLPVAALGTGTRVPEDLEPATPEQVWAHVLAPPAANSFGVEAAR